MNTSSWRDEVPGVFVTQDHVDAGAQCSICLEDLQLSEPVMRLSCCHLYHEPCISPWLDQSSVCPNCRQKVVSRNDPEPTFEDEYAMESTAVGEIVLEYVESTWQSFVGESILRPVPSTSLSFVGERDRTMEWVESTLQSFADGVIAMWLEERQLSRKGSLGRRKVQFEGSNRSVSDKDVEKYTDYDVFGIGKNHAAVDSDYFDFDMEDANYKVKKLKWSKLELIKIKRNSWQQNHLTKGDTKPYEIGKKVTCLKRNAEIQKTITKPWDIVTKDLIFLQSQQNRLRARKK